MTVIIVSPSIALELKRPPTPRQLWKAEHHARRYERRYGRRPGVYPGFLGSFNGVRIVTTVRGATA